MRLPRLPWHNGPRQTETSVWMTTPYIVMRGVIEAQLLALGVPPERSVDEARLILLRHLDTPMSENGVTEMHDDIVSTALAWA